MRSLTRCGVVTSGSSLLLAGAATSRRAIHSFCPVGTGDQAIYSLDFINKPTLTPNNNLDASKTTQTACVSGTLHGHAYTEEEMFNPLKIVEVAAKSHVQYANNHQSKYVIPVVPKEYAADAIAIFDRLVKDEDHLALFFRKFIRTYPATIFIVGSNEEIAAFEANEAAKIPNNKLIVGRINAKVPHVNIRSQIVEFFSTLVSLASTAESEAEIIAYGTPVFEKFMLESFFSRQYLWRMYEEILRSMDTLPSPATPYERRCLSLVLEKQIKLVLNGVADLPWASEEFCCPSRGMEVSPNRMCAEAGMW